MQDGGVYDELRSECWWQWSQNFTWPARMITWGSMSRGVKIAHERNPWAPAVRTTLANGIENSWEFHPDMPSGNVIFLRDIGNKYSPSKDSFMDKIKIVPVIDKGFAAAQLKYNWSE